MNVLVLMCDHHRFDALSCLGNPLARTPNLDRLAARSVRFDNAFTQSPVCAPARHSLATGRYAHAQGVITNSHKPHPGMVTIGHALQPLGHRRFQQGHMHWTDPDVDNGYEPWLTHAAWHDAMPPEVAARYEWEGQGVTRRTTAGPSPRTREQYSGHFVATNAVEQMESAVERGEKFLCWTAFSEPHPPFYPPREIYERFDQSQIQLPAQAPPDAPPPHELILHKRREWAHLTEVEVRQIFYKVC
ncbi:MAG: sulfatase-like hydrolase/transferase [Armatimonadota bacterium]